jgi:lipoate-protein ligase A
VLLAPGQVVWADVLVPRGDALWDDDVGRAFHWLGQAWVAALGRLGLSGAAVHRGGLVSTPWSRRVCFAGLGPGEVTLGGRKVVGMAQRRTREGALFQCACLLAWEPAALVDILALDGEEARAAAVSELSGVAVGIGPTPVPAVEAAFVDVLP